MSEPRPFRRDPSHWLLRLSPDEWIRAGLSELEKARAQFKTKNPGGAIVGLKRAAGMALNGALVRRPNDAWGRKYSEHLAALAADRSAPEEVRRAAQLVHEARAPSGPVVSLRTPSHDERLVEAARIVMAHAYALVHGKPPPEGER
jgi:HEPN domain-containing protein